MDRWRRRAEHARRMKGDPAPTYAELETAVASLTATAAKQGEVIRTLRQRCDRLDAECAQLRERALPQLGPYVVDEDVVRPYVREPVPDRKDGVR